MILLYRIGQYLRYFGSRNNNLNGEKLWRTTILVITIQQSSEIRDLRLVNSSRKMHKICHFLEYKIQCSFFRLSIGKNKQKIHGFLYSKNIVVKLFVGAFQNAYKPLISEE